MAIRQKNWIEYPKKRFIRYKEACERYSVSRDNMRILATKAGALYQLGEHLILIDMFVMDKYFEENYKVKGDYKGYGIY